MHISSTKIIRPREIIEINGPEGTQCLYVARVASDNNGKRYLAFVMHQARDDEPAPTGDGVMRVALQIKDRTSAGVAIPATPTTTFFDIILPGAVILSCDGKPSENNIVDTHTLGEVPQDLLEIAINKLIISNKHPVVQAFIEGHHQEAIGKFAGSQNYDKFVAGYLGSRPLDGLPTAAWHYPSDRDGETARLLRGEEVKERQAAAGNAATATGTFGKTVPSSPQKRPAGPTTPSSTPTPPPVGPAIGSTSTETPDIDKTGKVVEIFVGVQGLEAPKKGKTAENKPAIAKVAAKAAPKQVVYETVEESLGLSEITLQQAFEDGIISGYEACLVLFAASMHKAGISIEEALGVFLDASQEQQLEWANGNADLLLKAHEEIDRVALQTGITADYTP